MNSEKLRIICIDDIIEDSDLIRETLKSEGLNFDFDFVSDEAEYEESLKSKKYDIILSDYNLPGFSGIAALLLARKLCPQVPFICVSGTIGEDLAIELLHLGASDYILKDRLFKLPVAIQRILKEEEVKRAKVLAENELKQSKEKYRNLVEQINDVVYEIDNKGNILYISPVIREITGYPETYYLGRPIFDFIYEKDLKESIEKFENIIFAGMMNPFEFRIKDQMGNILWLRTSSKPVIEEGKTTGIRGTAINITKIKIADEQILKLSSAIEQSPATVIITDNSGRIEYVNPKFTGLTGYSPEEVKGRNTRILKSGYTEESEYETLWKTIISGKVWRGEFRNKRKDGSLYWEHASIAPITDTTGEITHFVAVKEDITEKKKILDELILAKENAEASTRLKSAFLSNISHEIRTPLNGIMGFADLLQNPAITDEERDAYFKILVESSRRMLNTINDIVEMSRIEADKLPLHITRIELHEFCDYYYNLFKREAEGKNLLFNFSSQLDNGLVFIDTDKNKLGTIVSNFLKNAIKFTSEGHVEFGVSFDKGSLILFVKDSGMGIPAGMLTSVFKRFVQADVSLSRDYEGLGLGLSIAKSYADMLGGMIEVQSVEGEGSTFTYFQPATSFD